ncbi:hypothetical protein BJ166DRAFT_291523 [Pestalotiopsis sp. NC0098]|nr:hypothetical protein BJ166DRAFT_291523 [Pestalotiopsis sp. NC0098]
MSRDTPSHRPYFCHFALAIFTGNLHGSTNSFLLTAVFKRASPRSPSRHQVTDGLLKESPVDLCLPIHSYYLVPRTYQPIRSGNRDLLFGVRRFYCVWSDLSISFYDRTVDPPMKSCRYCSMHFFLYHAPPVRCHLIASYFMHSRRRLPRKTIHPYLWYTT